MIDRDKSSRLDPAPFGDGDDDEDTLSRLIDMLQQVDRTLDQMWQKTVPGGNFEDAIRVAEASHDIHRALIALTPPQ